MLPVPMIVICIRGAFLMWCLVLRGAWTVRRGGDG
jgi:hypothetical protein